MVTCASVVSEPGSNVTLAEPSAFVTVPPVVAETSVGGPRAFVEDDEPIGGLAVTLVSAVASVLVVTPVRSDPITALPLEPDAIPDVDATPRLSVLPCVALAPPAPPV